jgi:hypothetical protein
MRQMGRGDVVLTQGYCCVTGTSAQIKAKEDAMSLRTVMQAGPAKANELFAKLLDT